MKREIKPNFNGILNIKDRENIHKAFFHVDNDLITVIPCSLESQNAIYASTTSDAPPKKRMICGYMVLLRIAAV